ncbi:hypothetical protein P3X46_019166 [Hevea brasiliensis]|uniref:VQ domain-containing protein n=1 Tax=Hevea brasiliensis TaxID=3981 RepID=A0ABQ9LUX1_HEVBR|nr:uncharacterized protein LOC110645632 [Hevea brasiliensis]XP_057984741.1 uncharacterized protein LOC131169573 [Hevea brasiliensis]KAJ9170540.1 hypothetical protein P3X46_018641 [Hevea brasiliensis]KAJ9171118.1 hypothetical protein P3X46_019166 [Hevea brasiliensis]
MDAYSSSYSSSSSSPMYISQYPHEGKGLKASQLLHSVRKPQLKPWKKPIAPLAPTPPRVYKVDPINFKDLVQKLTGAPEPSQPQQRLQRVAPPPLVLDKDKPALFSREFAAAAPLQLLPSPVKTPFSALFQELMSDTTDPKLKKISDSVVASPSLELNLLSPSTHGWCSFPLLSPGTLSSLEQSTVL